MKERPILFSGPMMRANLLGLKTQTRRIVKPQPDWSVAPLEYTNAPGAWAPNEAEDSRRCPYGVPGDRLWARETWQQVVPAGHGQWMTVGKPDEKRAGARLVYAATVADGEHPPRWRSSLHMPRWASRFTPLVVEVRVQRLQDIDGDDIRAEGIAEDADAEVHEYRDGRLIASWNGPRGAYAALWDSINGAGAWALNPWVWAVTYRPQWDQVHSAPVDLEKGMAACRRMCDKQAANPPDSFALGEGEEVSKRSPQPGRVFGSAAISPCGRYRYELTRSWDAKKPAIAFVMLNPSTADAADDDPTIRRCIGFANRWGFGELRVYNIFALRTSNPEDLRGHPDPFGPDFDQWSARPRECEKVIVAWGTFGTKGINAARGKVFARQHLDGVELWALGLNADGSPRHPLYVRADQELTRWEL